MSLPMPPLYHWSPTETRPRIERRGLKPTCPWESRLMVCLGLTPSHAWSLSGAISAEQGESWDLWQVTLDDGDEVHPLPFYGHRLDEVRVANKIPKSRCWLVGTRTVARAWTVTRAA